MSGASEQLASLREQATSLGFAAGWGVLKAVPVALSARSFRAGADAATVRNGSAVRQLRTNLRRVVGQARTETELDDTWRPYRAVGCSNCNNGYRGRVGIYQVMPITDKMQQLILKEGNATDIARCAKEDGVRDLRQSGLVKVRLGVTTLEEVISCTNE